MGPASLEVQTLDLAEAKAKDETRAAAKTNAAAEAKAAKTKPEQSPPILTFDDEVVPNNVKIERAIRNAATKTTGELTKADLEKVTRLYLSNNQLTEVQNHPLLL